MSKRPGDDGAARPLIDTVFERDFFDGTIVLEVSLECQAIGEFEDGLIVGDGDDALRERGQGSGQQQHDEQEQ
jgi:hypothetical protein